MPLCLRVPRQSSEELWCVSSFFPRVLTADLASSLLLRICFFFAMKLYLLLVNVRIMSQLFIFIFKINHSVILFNACRQNGLEPVSCVNGIFSYNTVWSLQIEQIAVSPQVFSLWRRKLIFIPRLRHSFDNDCYFAFQVLELYWVCKL